MLKNSTLCVAFFGLILLLGPALVQAAPPKAKQTASGVFLGIEQGNYAHWKLRKIDGEEVSFFILNPDSSVEKVLASPKEYVGKKCLVELKTTTENIPEAGGKMEVEQIVSVEWLK